MARAHAYLLHVRSPSLQVLLQLHQRMPVPAQGGHGVVSAAAESRRSVSQRRRRLVAAAGGGGGGGDHERGSQLAVLDASMNGCQQPLSPHNTSCALWSLEGVAQHVQQPPDFLIGHQQLQEAGLIRHVGGGWGVDGVVELAAQLLQQWRNALQAGRIGADSCNT
jgi:hypothetical protein